MESQPHRRRSASTHFSNSSRLVSSTRPSFISYSLRLNSSARCFKQSGATLSSKQRQAGLDQSPRVSGPIVSVRAHRILNCRSPQFAPVLFIVRIKRKIGSISQISLTLQILTKPWPFSAKDRLLQVETVRLVICGGSALIAMHLLDGKATDVDVSPSKTSPRFNTRAY